MELFIPDSPYPSSYDVQATGSQRLNQLSKGRLAPPAYPQTHRLPELAKVSEASKPRKTGHVWPKVEQDLPKVMQQSRAQTQGSLHNSTPSTVLPEWWPEGTWGGCHEMTGLSLLGLAERLQNPQNQSHPRSYPSAAAHCLGETLGRARYSFLQSWS